MRYLLLFAVLVICSCGFSGTEQKAYEAMENGDFAKAKELIKDVKDVNKRVKFGYTLIFEAEDVETAQLLIDKGADVNIAGGGDYPENKTSYARHYDYSPLHVIRDPEVADLLIKNGADVNKKAEYGVTPLHQVKSAEMIKVLLSNGADVNARVAYGTTPLAAGVDDNEDDVINMAKLLMEAGADPNIPDNMGHYPLHHVRRDNAELAELLMKYGADYRKKTDSGNSPLCYAVADNSMELIKLYFRSGADFDMTCGRWDKPDGLCR